MNRLLHIPRPDGPGSLTGMLDLPSDPSAGGWPVACILVSPGVKPRVGPHRLYRKLSVAFVERNIPVLRLDFAGMGDSDGEYETPVLSEVYARVQAGRHLHEVRAAMDYLQAQYGVQRFIVGGLCGAAITGLLVAEGDPRVCGLYSIGMPVVLVGAKADSSRIASPAVLAAHREALWRKLFLPSRWLRLLTFQSDYRLLWRVAQDTAARAMRRLLPVPSPAVATAGAGGGAGPTDLPDFLDRNFIRALFRLASTRRSALMLFGASDRNLGEYRDCFESACGPRLGQLEGSVDVEVIPEANHVLGSPEWVDRARRLTDAWLDRRILRVAAAPTVSASALRAEIIDRFDRFLQLRDSWDELLARSSGDSVTLTWEWLSTWWRLYGEGRRLCMVALWSGPRLAGAAPLLSRRVADRSTAYLPLRRIELLASGEAVQDQVCSDYIGLVAERGLEPAVAEGVLDALLAGRCGPWDELLLADVQEDAPATRALLEAARRRRLPSEILERAPCAVAPLPKSWEEFLEGLSSTQRYRVRRALREFEQAGGSYEIADSPEDLQRMLPELIELHQARWTARGEPGAFGSRLRRGFHEKFMPLALERGWLRLGVLRVQGRAIGAIYNLRYAGRIFFYQSGIVPQENNHLRPGMLLHANEIYAAIQSGCVEYDFLKRGESQYKDAWASASHDLVLIRIARDGVLNRLVVLGQRARARLSRLKHALKKKNGRERGTDEKGLPHHDRH